MHRTLSRGSRAAQRGMVLFVALVVLVLMTLAGLAMMRSVDTTTLLAGNLAFQQAAVRASDQGIEAAIRMLQTKAASVGGVDLNSNDTTNGYFATLDNATQSPAANQSWRSFWEASLAANARPLSVSGGNAAPDAFGNTVWYVVHRMCRNAQPPNAGGQCVIAPGMAISSGNAEEAGQLQLQGGANRVFYRITVRVVGPRRTESYVQAHITL